jgi:DNA-directed RNA polymerase specialized sigma24 family protein
MLRSGIILDQQREGLVKAILDEIKSWPETHRLIFMRSHYQGDSPKCLSDAFGLGEHEVRSILQSCDRKLRGSLRAFRERTLGSVSQPDLPYALFVSSSIYR